MTWYWLRTVGGRPQTISATRDARRDDDEEDDDDDDVNINK